MSERVLECVQEDIRTNTHTKAQTHNKLLNTRTYDHTNGRSQKLYTHAGTHTRNDTHTRTHTSLASKTNFTRIRMRGSRWVGGGGGGGGVGRNNTCG